MNVIICIGHLLSGGRVLGDLLKCWGSGGRFALFVKLATFPPEGRERCSLVHNGLRATPGEPTPKVMTTGKTTATPKITFFANC